MISAFAADAPPRLLHEVVAEVMFTAGHATDFDEALELADPLLGEIRALVIEYQADSERRGLTWQFELYGSNDEYLRGASAADPTLSEAERQTRARRAHARTIRTTLTSLTAPEFEIACTGILRIMGCADPHTSSQGNDGGIDFYGRLELEGRLDNFSTYGGFDRRVGLWLIGQAKHYPTRNIQTAHIRELVGSVELARTKGAIHTWPGLHLRPFDAVIQVFFTTGDFSSGSNKLIDNSGLVAMNGDQLATFLADAGLGLDSTNTTFTESKFRMDLGL
ncbi:restriction endonuclease [Frigoribacterium sp. MEB024]|jgi:hypothetical protein|uniref:restriction endonuclease n=1 Tax=Frigoribacterium sp. MEB024 TaxID=1589899 RepID=UPI000A641B57|nr:restriction endonuclease [Frigoribacterium sp. MEB024]